MKKLEGTTKPPLILAAGFTSERVETAIYDASLSRLGYTSLRRFEFESPSRLPSSRRSGLPSLLDGFLGCLRDLRERNPREFEELAAIALTSGPGPVAAGDEGSLIVGDQYGTPRIHTEKRLFVGLKDYIFFSLTGAHATDPTTASSSGLFDVRTGQWDRGRLKFLRISESQLPTVLRGDRGPSARESASVLDRWRRKLFFKKPLPVVNDTDTLSALHIGAGAEETGDLLISLSGRECVSYLVDVIEDRPCRYLLHFRGKRYHATAAQRGAGEYLRWGSETFAPGRDESLERGGGFSLKCEGETAEGKAGGAVVTFCPFPEAVDETSGDEASDDEASGEPPGGMIAGLTLSTRGEDILRGIVEGTALSVFQAVRETGGDAASRVFLCADLPSRGRLAAVLALLLNSEVGLVDSERCTPLAGCALNALRTLGTPLPPSLQPPAVGPAAEKKPERAVESTHTPDPERQARLLRRLRSFSSLRESMEEYGKRMYGI